MPSLIAFTLQICNWANVYTTSTITVIISTIKLSILQGVLTGISYNGMRPLDMAHQKSHHTMVRGVLTPLTSIPYDYKVIDLKPI